MTVDGEHEGGGDGDAPRRRLRLRFHDRLFFQAYPCPGKDRARFGPRDFPLKEWLPILRSEARNARRRSIEVRRRPGVVGRTRAVRLRRF